MAIRTKKISQMDPKGAPLASTDLLEISELVSGSYVTKSITGQEIIDSVPPTSVEWGDIGGVLSTQIDLQNALNGKVDENATITGATKTKITYDSKGLVTSGADATTADIADSTNKRYVTDANLTVINNTSGTNTGDQTLSGLGGVPTTRTISTTSPLSGGGDLSADRTLSIATANTTTTGALSSTDWNTFNGKQSALVSGTNIKTINGTTILGSGDLTISTGITIGTTSITSGTVGRVLFQGTGNVVSQSTNLFWDLTNNRLGIGTATPEYPLDILGNLSGLNIGFKLRNSATSGYTEIMCFNNGGTLSDRMYMGVGGTTTGDSFQNRGYFVASSNLEGVNFTATKPTTGDIRFFTGGVNERLRINGNGNIGINTTTDAGYKLDVNGTARVSNMTAQYYNTGQNGSSYQVQGNNVLDGGDGLRINYSPAYSKISLFTNSGGQGLQVNNGSVSIGPQLTPNASSILDLTSTTKGFLPPRMTTTQKNAIASPATGLMVYDTTLNLMSVYNGTTWITL